MSHAFDKLQPGVGNRAANVFSGFNREERVVAAVDHQRRCRDVFYLTAKIAGGSHCRNLTQRADVELERTREVFSSRV